MPEEIARLMSLQAVDQELRELEDALGRIAGRSEQLREEIEKSQSELGRLEQEEKEAGLVRKRLERELAEGEARIRNKRMRLNLVRNDKELQALAHEIESLKENNQRLEAELLALMEAGEPRGPRIKELTELLEERRKEHAAAEKESAAEVEELKTRIGKRRVEREGITGNIDAALVQRYEVIFSRRGGLAVAAARSGTCQGCRMRLPPQLYNEIQKHRKVHFCPNCQRILCYEG